MSDLHTASNYHVGRRALGALLLGLLLTALVVALDTFTRAIGLTGLQQNVLRLAIVGVILFGLWRALPRTSLPAQTQRITWAITAIVLLAWQAVVWWLALAAAFQPRPGVPALPLAIVLPLLVGLPILLRSRTVGAILDATPASWLVGLQVYRIFGAVFLVAWAAGDLPTIFAWPAGLGDTIVGLLALPAAVYVASGTRAGRLFGISWNLLGLLDLVDAVAIGALTAPGPLQRIVPDHVSTLALYPLVMIPAYAVPLSMLLHALSLRQLVRLGRRPASGRVERTPASTAPSYSTSAQLP